jgi:PII-like signaling protein
MENYTNEKTLLRIYINEHDRYGDRPLSEALVELFNREGYSGATVLKCIAGFWAHGGRQGGDSSGDDKHPPVIVELIAGRGRVNIIMPRIAEMMDSGMITMATVKVALKRIKAIKRAIPEVMNMTFH